MLKIRLQRIGRKNDPAFRVVLTDSKNSTKSGRFLEILGTYNPKAGEKNLENAFAIKRPADVAGKKVFLVDDVYTTGSTMEECARALKNSGAKQVWGIAIAREE